MNDKIVKIYYYWNSMPFNAWINSDKRLNVDFIGFYVEKCKLNP